MKGLVGVFAILFVVGFLFLTLGVFKGDVTYLKENGPAYLKSLGYEVLGYEGFQRGVWGGKAWFLIRRPDAPEILYSCFLIERRGEIHFYYPTPHINRAIVED